MTALPHPHANPLEWERGCNLGGGGSMIVTFGRRGAASSIEIITEGIHGVPSLSLTLGNTGFTSLAVNRQLSQWSTGKA